MCFERFKCISMAPRQLEFHAADLTKLSEMKIKVQEAEQELQKSRRQQVLQNSKMRPETIINLSFKWRLTHKTP